MERLAIGHTLRNRAFVATTVHMNLTYNITLLGFVSFHRAGVPVECRELAVLPAAHSGKEVHHLRLLLLP